MMDIKQIFQSFISNKQNITNEASTKQFIVIPIIKNILGFDVYSPSDFLSEVVSDVAGKKGEKLDYALKVNGKISIIIECKHHTNNLDNSCRAQLERYFACRDDIQDAKIAVLTNGLVWKFFSDSMKSNVLDSEPFYVFDIQNEATYSNLEDFKKERFNIENITKWIRIRNRIRDMRRFFSTIFQYSKETSPEEFKKLLEFAVSIGIDIGGRLTDTKAHEYQHPFLQARDEFTEDLVKRVVDKGLSTNKESLEVSVEEDIITPEELDIWKTVQIICSDVVQDFSLIQIKNRAGIGNSLVCFEGKQTKPIVGIHLEKDNKSITIGKNRERIFVSKTDLSQICKHKMEICNAAMQYIKTEEIKQ